MKTADVNIRRQAQTKFEFSLKFHFNQIFIRNQRISSNKCFFLRSIDVTDNVQSIEVVVIVTYLRSIRRLNNQSISGRTYHSMSQSIDFRINDLINEYLDYKGYSKTVEIFRDERTDRQETISKFANSQLHEQDKEKYRKIKVNKQEKINKRF